jgi:anti-sigma factor RsiW
MEGNLAPDCTEISEHLVGYLDGELPEALEDRVRKHLALCGSCALEAKRLEESWKLLDLSPGLRAPAGFADEVMARAGRRAISTRFLRYRPIAAAAAVFLMLVLGMWVLRRDPGEGRREMEIVRNLDLLENLDFIEEVGDDVEFLEMLNLEEEWY